MSAASRASLAARAAGVLLAALVLAPVRAAAQVSPGPLAAAHADLDSPAMCFKCHARGAGAMTRLCLDCHTEIAAVRAARRGFHGKAIPEKECASCHPDHAGRDFAMVTWSEGAPERFDHRRTGWPLDGKHAKLECAKCHTPKFQVDRTAKLIRAHDRSKSWLGLDTACASCHEDVHKGQFGIACAKCHNATDWKTTETRNFDHDRTRYPLRGKHVAVKCETCHDPVSAWGKKPAFDRCMACHTDAHAGQATLGGRPADCDACHDVRGFARSTFTVAQHARTKYPLEGRHAAIECATCHARRPAEAATLGSSRVVMRPRFERCASCHADPHGGQLAGRADRGACESCHRVAAFRPSNFGVAEHAKTHFALDGAHQPLECRACHGAARVGLPPLAADSLGRAKFAFALAERECAQCHHDTHGGEFKTARGGCRDCHDTRAFRPSAVDVARHETYAFKLAGAHRAVPCAGCHRGAGGRARESSLVIAAHAAPLTFTVAKSDCASCHADPHGGQFAGRADRGACEACHGLEAFRPADRFDHDRAAAFKLQGAHARVACAACHPSQRGAGGVMRVKYHGVPSRCESCHSDTHDARRTGDAGPGFAPRPITPREVVREES